MQNDVSAAIAGSAAMAGVPTPAQVVVSAMASSARASCSTWRRAARTKSSRVDAAVGPRQFHKVQRSLVADRPFAPPYEPNAKPLVPALVVGSSGPEETA